MCAHCQYTVSNLLSTEHTAYAFTRQKLCGFTPFQELFYHGTHASRTKMISGQLCVTAPTVSTFGTTETTRIAHRCPNTTLPGQKIWRIDVRTC